MKTLNLALGIAMSLALLPVTAAAQSPETVARGAQLYGQHCMRCHSARSAMERTDREWVTIVNHMRSRANLMKSDAQAMTVFLQAINAPEASGVATASAAGTPDPSAAPAGGAAVTGEEEGGPLLVLVDLGDPTLDPETRGAIQRYLELLRIH